VRILGGVPIMGTFDIPLVDVFESVGDNYHAFVGIFINVSY